MPEQESNEAEWLAWIEVQKSAVTTCIEGDLTGAIKIVDEYLLSSPAPDLARQAIGYRGSLRETQGDLIGAEQDFRKAIEMSEHPDYERFTLEDSVAGLYERRGDLETAAWWYVRALETAAKDPTTSGATALRRLLRLRAPGALNQIEQSLAERVVRQAWHLFRLEGAPDFSNLAATLETIIKAHGRPFSADAPPSPKAAD